MKNLAVKPRLSILPIGTRARITGYNFRNPLLAKSANDADEFIKKFNEGGLFENSLIEVYANANGAIALRELEFGSYPFSMRHNLADALEVEVIKIGKGHQLRKACLELLTYFAG